MKVKVISTSGKLDEYKNLLMQYSGKEIMYSNYDRHHFCFIQINTLKEIKEFIKKSKGIKKYSDGEIVLTCDELKEVDLIIEIYDGHRE